MLVYALPADVLPFEDCQMSLCISTGVVISSLLTIKYDWYTNQIFIFLNLPH